MYRLLIVEDEPRQVRALVNIINQLKPEYEICTANNGQEALSLFSENLFDVVMTDIRMPNMNGIQLIESIKREGIQTRIIILSGYGEFSYAQKAIRFGVTDYLVKPISKNDLLEILNKVEKEIKAEREAKTQEEDLKQKLNTSLPVYLEHQLNKWISGLANNEELNEIEEIIPHKGYGLVCITAFSNIHNAMEITKDDFKQYAKFAMKESLDSLGHSISFFMESDDRYMVTVLVNVNKIRISSHENIIIMHNYLKTIEEKFNVVATIGVGVETDNIHRDIIKCYLSAHIATERRFFFGLQKVLFSNSDNMSYTEPKVRVRDLEKEIEDAINQKNRTDIARITNYLFENVKNNCNANPKQFKEDIPHFLLNQTQCIINIINNDKYNMLIEKIKTRTLLCEDYSELRHFTNEILCQIIDIKSDPANDKNRILIEKCKNYIDEKYMDDISLDVIAQRYFFNSSYFSNLFKCYMGIGFSEYLLKVRIQNAQRLLSGTEDSMADIASKVGFNNQSYFNRAFKKETGISPLKYRQIKVS